MDNQQVVEFRLHYSLNDENLHSMDAKVYNECEKQFIQMILSLNKYFDNALEIEVSSREEGGVIGKYAIKFSRNPIFLILLTSATTGFFGNYFSTLHPTEITKNKLENIQKFDELIKNGILTPELYDYAAAHDNEMRKFKSNFFKSAKEEKRIVLLEVENSTSNNKQTIPYEKFDEYILKDEKETKEDEKTAKIYIVAPILIKDKRYNWKGIYENAPIDFKVTDDEFLYEVYTKQRTFENGSYIICKMKIKNTFDLNADSEKINFEVYEIIETGDDSHSAPIIRNKEKKVKKYATNLFEATGVEL